MGELRHSYRAKTLGLDTLGEAPKTGAPGSARATCLREAALVSKLLQHINYSFETGKTGFEKGQGMACYSPTTSRNIRRPRLCSASRWSLRASVSPESQRRSSTGGPERTSPNSFQVSPSNFINCICLIGAKSPAVVEIVTPGSSIGNFRS